MGLSLIAFCAPANGQLAPLVIDMHEVVPEFGSELGWSVAAGDVNGDGYDDAIVGVPHGDTGGVIDAGRVLVRFGPSFATFSILKTPVLKASADFGIAVATGDVNGDGIDDVVVGSPDESIGLSADVGRAYVFMGPALTAPLILDIPGAVPFSDFGRAVATGDVVAGGGDEILIGAPEASVGGASAGKVFVFSGTGALLATLSNPGPANGDQFGWSISTGDVDADGLADILVGEPNGTAGGLIEAGTVHVYSGGTFVKIASLSEPVPEASAEFGRFTAMGDLNGDGNADLAIGVPDAKPFGVADAGEVVVFFGPNFASSMNLTEPNIEQGADFGSALAIGDTDGDGFDDLVIGAEDAVGDTLTTSEQDAGEAFLFLGPSLTTVKQLVPSVVHDDDDFGYSAATGDFNNDGLVDVLIGAKDGEVTMTADQGRAFAFVSQKDLTLTGAALSASAGGLVTIGVNGGVAMAGRSYALLGTTLGSAPGFQNGQVIVPINVDPLITPLLLSALPGALGVMNPAGQATVVLGAPSGVIPAVLVGTDFTFAWLTTDVFNYASKPVVFEITP